jgi:hypothetical protein
MKQFLEGCLAGLIMIVPPLCAWLYKTGGLL